MLSLTKQHITTIKDAAKKLTGAKRREFQAQVSIDYLNSKPHLAEKIFGWDRKTVALGLNELRSGVVCIDDFKARGNKKTEEKYRNWKLIWFLWQRLKAKLTLNFKQRLHPRASQPKPCERL